MLVGFFLLLFALPLFPQPFERLMPVPAKLTSGAGMLRVDSSFGVSLSGATDDILQRGVERFLVRLSKRTGMALLPSMSSDGRATLRIHCRQVARNPVMLGEDESWSLRISSSGARMEAQTSTGVLRGLETLLQLLQSDAGRFSLPAVSIEDRPRFAWRGLMIDVSRHFMPQETILRQLDAMAAVKLNVFHWHLSDDQGFRVESLRYPKLHGRGSGGEWYTQTQVRQVVEYARERGIRVVPEFDMPGHTAAWLVGYPGLASGPGPFSIAETFSLIRPTMNPADEALYEFLDGFIAEMVALFPDQYFHIGGDEVNGLQWKANPTVQRFIRDQGLGNNRGLQAYFNRRLEAIVSRHGKVMIGWDEVLHPDLPKSVVIQSWRGAGSLAKAASAGHRGVLSHGYYLDHMQPAATHYRNHPPAGSLGGEACMWTEYVSPENIDMRIWPRAAAIAERLWSPESVTDIPSMYTRLAGISRHLEELGLQHNASHMRMIARLAGKHKPEPLATLDSILEPVRMYARSTTHPYTTKTQLNRLVDATPPESRTAREFATDVETFLSGDLTAGRRVSDQLLIWRNNHEAVLPTLRSSALLTEVIPLSAWIRDLSEAGVEAMKYLEKDAEPPMESTGRHSQLTATGGMQVPPSGMQKHCVALLSQYGRSRARTRRNCAKPRYVAELVPAVSGAVERLIQAAGTFRDGSGAPLKSGNP